MNATASSDPRSPIAGEAAQTASAAWRPGTFALRDAWFPVAHSRDIGAGDSLRFVHGQAFCLRRGSDGVFAEDRRPDAQASGSGAAQRVPAIERYGYVWVWFGDRDNADPGLIPDIPFLHPNKPQPAYATGTAFFDCTYELLLENILDLTHIDYIHNVYSGDAEDAESDDVEFMATSETVTMIRTTRKRPTSRYQREVLGVEAPYQDQSAFTHIFIRSGMCFLHSHYSNAPSMPLMQSNTPESSRLTRANFAFGTQQTDDPAFRRQWPATAAMVAAQDNSVLAPQNPRYVDAPEGADLSTRFDAAGLEFRKRYNALVERQKRGDFSYLSDAEDGSDIAEILKVKRIGSGSRR